MGHPNPQHEFGRAETIAERKARLAYDKLYPWKPITQAKLDGAVCQLQFTDMTGNFDAGRHRYVLTIYPRYRWRRWLCVTGKGWASFDPSGFRETGQVLSSDEIARLRREAGV